jgi:hypothetical protein
MCTWRKIPSSPGWALGQLDDVDKSMNQHIRLRPSILAP